MIFKDYIHPDFQSFVESLTSQGFEIAVIGGTVRDFFQNKTNKHDYDCEVRFKDLNYIDWSELGIKDECVDKLPYGILKYSHEDFVVELSMPRVEVFDDSIRHKNFTAKFDYKMSYIDAVKRRDFTINSMMYIYQKQWIFNDPLSGLDDLNKMSLVPCSENFKKDPVRLLRAIRFQIKDKFTFDDRISESFLGYDISMFSYHYLQLEAMKSKTPIFFLNRLYELLGVKLNCVLWKKLLNTSWSHVLELKDLRPFVYFVDSFDYITLSPVLGQRNAEFEWPLKTSHIKGLSFDQFKLQFKFKLNQIKWVEKLDEKWTSFLNENLFIDFNFKQIQKKDELSKELESIKPSDRSYFVLYKKLIRIHENNEL